MTGFLGKPHPDCLIKFTLALATQEKHNCSWTMPTLSDVAKLAGVGVMSVSRVVNGTRRVSPAIERKVRLAIEKIGYVPNEAARILKGTRSSVIGLIVPDLADPFFAELGHAVQQTAWDAGYMTLMAASGHREDLEISETELMVHRRVAGVLAVAIGKNNRHFAEAQGAGVPVVAIDRPIQNVTSDTLTVDNHNAARRATEHLIGHGHRHILCIADTERIHTKQQRVAGYKRAMRDAGLQPKICLVGDGISVAALLDTALAWDAPPSALFAASNLVAIDVVRDLQRRGLTMPEDLALICFDDFSAATLVTPMISVIRQPVAEIGRQAAMMLLQRLDTDVDAAEGFQHVVIPTQLLIRGSCGLHTEGTEG
jgi:LacI family transcriptional regulator